MQQSTTPDFNTLRSLFAGLEHHLAIHAVLTGAAQGQVFADFTPDPRWAAVWVQHRVYLAGSADGAAPLIALRDLLTNTIAPAARARGDYAFGLYYAPSWHDHLGDLLPELPHKALDRQYFVTDQPGLLAPTGGQLSATTHLTAVDASLMAQTGLVNHARLAEEMCSERSSV